MRIWAKFITRKGCVSGSDKLPQTLSLTQDVTRRDKLLETGFSGAFFSNMTLRHGMCERGLNDHTTRQSATVRSALCRMLTLAILCWRLMTMMTAIMRPRGTMSLVILHH